ncbi:TonB-dependent receptor [Paracidobacterium acidisoli]|uniref:TonB-dependent receptor n=1 Tax=Paracidobacterium acidisoli TaxID=2303751 RepID=A0A372IME2_9BACT|nr:TonB-dependent receptor [Paracidobacterium acidisoli]MBT9332344.1 TonB-dependent receptor [Paracidobacterium acidisoli]
MKRVLVFVVLVVISACGSAWGQVNYGEVHLKITDPSGAAIKASVELSSSGNGYDKSFTANSSGVLRVPLLPYGAYQLTISQSGFTPFSKVVEISSALPLDENIQLSLASVVTQVKVTGAETLIDPDSPSSVMEIGSKQIQERVPSLPGRSVQDLVNSQPGWLYEGNAVLHPRGSEYQTQFVVDGIPLTDNRSPSFGPEIEADDLDSMSIYTAGYPAEYGRKMGGVVELDTRRQTDPGLHGEVVLSGGSYDSASGYGRLQYVWGKNTVNGSASGGMTSHYLNPVVPQNFTNTGTVGDFSAGYERDLTPNDRLSFSVRHELSRFLIPNELLQEQAGQIQNGDNFETMGIVHYQHIISPDSLIALSGMVRDNANDLYSNQNPTPIDATQKNDFREGYFKGTYSLHHGHQEFKAGIESDSIFLHEFFTYNITAPDFFDDDTPQSLTFAAQRPDLEQSAFIEDLIHLGKWTVSAGLRWDHYQLLLNQNAVSPRLSISRYVPSLNMVLHASFDRIFQTPSFENILISSSTKIDALSDDFLRLPVQPSKGNYYEGGLTEAFYHRMRLDVNLYRRDVRNYADDDQLLNTGVSYPIAFDKSVIYGAESKLTLVQLGKLNGFVSYSYMVGNVWYPVTGGLFLGDDADAALTQLNGHFPDSQDQRNTLRTRFQYQVIKRAWFAGGADYGSGLPFEFDGDPGEALAEYGPEVISRINFDRGRIRPLLSVNASLGVDVYSGEKVKMHFQADGDNLNNRLNVIDFGGLFSGNAIGPARSFGLRLNTTF